jgi:hypothetical protein
MVEHGHRIANLKVVLQRKPAVLSSWPPRSFLDYPDDRRKASIVTITAPSGKILDTIVLAEFPHGELALKTLHAYLSQEWGFDPKAMNLEIIRPIVVIGPD